MQLLRTPYLQVPINQSRIYKIRPQYVACNVDINHFHRGRLVGDLFLRELAENCLWSSSRKLETGASCGVGNYF